ncbi:hypothetical protein J2Z40_001895 [Cytobacillus eiseniae]|uniref:YppG-like protein n=1 Tax=Cytobacillus eiseniae TaxID=762947 RepID=A0ABS4REI8_9BACI|nr:YppG family protein [Cytobacillus eiseniae]MBP2241333.1 hypothetical protein [Cytobacillus eiseniae]
MFGRRGHRPHFEQYAAYNGMNHQNHSRQHAQSHYPNIPGNWGAPYMPQYPAHYPEQQMMNPNFHSANMYQNYQTYPYGQQKQQSYAHSIFQNPLEPETNSYYGHSKQPNTVNPYMNPYPKQSFIPKQPSGVQSVMNSFKTQDGTLDFNKMVDTAGSMMNAVNQVSSIVKGIGGFIKV